MKTIIYFVFALLVPLAGKAQVDTTASATADSTFENLFILQQDTLRPGNLESLLVDTTTTLQANPTDTLESAKPVIKFKVRQWAYQAPMLAKLAATDSTLRWQVWLNWLQKKNRDPGVITYRLGSLGRENTMQLNAQSPRYQKLFWENVPMNNPITGMANWSFIPLHKLKKVYGNNLGTTHRTTFDLKEYYLNKPLTKLKYTQSSFDTRGLEFMASYNFGRKTNAELSYWNRKGGGEYPNSKVAGNQIYGRITHILDHHQEVKLNFASTKYKNGMPFGYAITNPFTYNFSRFSTTANKSSGHAEHSSSILSLNYYRRSDTTKPATLKGTVYMRNLKRNLRYSADTVSYQVRNIGLAVKKWYQTGALELEGSASVNYFAHNDGGNDPLSLGSWLLLNAEGKASYSLSSILKVSGIGSLRARNDGFSDHRLGVRLDLALSSLFKINAGITTGSRMPTPQQLYWQGLQYRGYSDLQKENVTSMHARLTLNPSRNLKVGAEGYLKKIENGILTGNDSTFANNRPYGSLSTDVFARYNNTHWEFSGSATLQQFGHFLTSSTTPLPVNNIQRIWFKASAYVKGYLFHHATYIKAGLSGVISPQAYKPDRYFPALNLWQPNGDGYIPSFNRLDVDVSARLRWIMFVLRYENVLDDLTQPGYFETAGYPMPGKRFIFGVRVYFRN